jgi:DeoR family suf operon transcriptional repressor
VAETGTALATLPTARRAILTSLKKHGERRADDLATDLAVTVSAIRQHLAGLEADGLVVHRELRHGPGRPRHLYALSDAGEAMYPKTYGELTNELLTYVEDEDPELLERIFERRRARRVERAQARLAGLAFPEQVEELTRILDEDGYLADVEPMDDGGFRVVEHNCAILAVATKYGSAACGTELAFIREVLPTADVDRVAHMMAGSHVCAYEIRPRPQGSRVTSRASLSSRKPK